AGRSWERSWRAWSIFWRSASVMGLGSRMGLVPAAGGAVTGGFAAVEVAGAGVVPAAGSGFFTIAGGVDDGSGFFTIAGGAASGFLTAAAPVASAFLATVAASGFLPSVFLATSGRKTGTLSRVAAGSRATSRGSRAALSSGGSSPLL